MIKTPVRSRLRTFRILVYKIKRVLLPRLLRSEETARFLRCCGVEIGKGTYIFDPARTIIDVTRPNLLKIGQYCKITSGATILTHDYSRSVLRRVYGEIIGEAAETIIGDNVFIGINAMILMGSNIGNNVIIGAGAVVKGTVPDNTIVAGNPAGIICTLEEFYQKRIKRYKEEAKWYARHWYQKYGKIPTIKEMDPFFPLFLKRNLKAVEENHLTIKLSGDDYEDTLRRFLQSKPLYHSYEEFLSDCNFETEDKN
jgi:carbonic anhydrase/acetyltransferase-like protein (isoleucine patch superfamily)